MKIALVNNYYYLRGGCERVLFDDQKALEELGHEVFPFAQYDKRNHFAKSEYCFPKIADPTEVVGAGRAKAAIDIIYSSSAGRAFTAFLNDFQPDVIHCHNIYNHLTTAILDAAQRCRLPTVLTVHDLKLVCPAYLGIRKGKPCTLCKDGGYWRCIRWKCHKGSYAASMASACEAYFNKLGGKYDSVECFLCPSRFMQKLLVDSGIAAARTSYHPNALTPKDFLPSFEPGQYVLYAGRLSEEKGLLTLLAAIERANIPLRIAGTGPLESEIQSRIRARGLPVQMEGFCSGERLAELFRNSAFTILPSEWYENASMSVLESFAYGKPVLASDMGGNSELVVDGLAGRLFPSGNFERLAEVANEMWGNRSEICNMGKRARRFVEQRFNHGKRIADLLSIYSNVIERSSLN